MMAGTAKKSGVSGLLPRVQGLPVGLPDARGHGDLQGGISLALLRGTIAPASCLCHGLDPYLGAHCLKNARRLVNFLGRAPVIGNLVKWLGGISQKRTMPQFAHGNISCLVDKRAKRQ